MMLGGTSSEVNPNSSWLNNRGMWLTYVIAVVMLHLVLLSFPFLSVAWVWTLTNVSHNTAMFLILHLVKGTPWDSGDQGKSRFKTHWEQIDNGEQFTATKKFLTVVPIIFEDLLIYHLLPSLNVIDLGVSFFGIDPQSKPVTTLQELLQLAASMMPTPS